MGKRWDAEQTAGFKSTGHPRAAAAALGGSVPASSARRRQREHWEAQGPDRRLALLPVPPGEF